MLRLPHKTLILLSGILWLGIGTLLFLKGFRLLFEAIDTPSSAPFLSFLAPYVGGWEQGGVLLIAFGLLLGSLKGRMILRKSAKRVVLRLSNFPNPTSIFNLYSPAFALLIGLMILLGMGMKIVGIPPDIRGVIDLAIGAALIQGGTAYFSLLSSVTTPAS